MDDVNYREIARFIFWLMIIEAMYQKYGKQAGADITGQLQVRPMLYTLYIDINLRVVKMLHTDNKQQITK